MSANPYEEHKLLCTTAIENTAARLGVDPVAFAELCQSGEFLHAALHPLWNWPDKIHPFGFGISRKLAALRRAKPQS